MATSSYFQADKPDRLLSMSMPGEYGAIAIGTGALKGSLRQCSVLEGHGFSWAVSSLRDSRHKPDLTRH
jgi:hypothetical protein